ncbi:MAG TPA: DegV family protein [Rubrobacter sp.]|nr:DegV family protein [Rubrobacter sp.]
MRIIRSGRTAPTESLELEVGHAIGSQPDVGPDHAADLGDQFLLYAQVLGELRDEFRRGDVPEVERANVLFAVSTLEYLAKSGRIGRAQRLVGTALDVRPVLKVAGGEVVPFKRTRGRKRQMAAIVDEVRPAVEAGRPLYFGHIAAPELVSELAENLGVEEKLVAEIGGVVGSHVGLGAYGVAHL